MRKIEAFICKNREPIKAGEFRYSFSKLEQDHVLFEATCNDPFVNNNVKVGSIIHIFVGNPDSQEVQVA